MHQKLRNTAKAVPAGKFLALNEGSLKFNNLSFHPKKPEKEKANEAKYFSKDKNRK